MNAPGDAGHDVGVSPRAAVIFDMDGVLVDSELQWKLSEGEHIRRLLPRWGDADSARIVGLGVVELHGFLVEQYGLEEPRDSFLALLDASAADIYGRRVTLTEGLPELLGELGRRRIPVGLASSSPRRWIRLVLERFSLAGSFSAVAGGDETPGRTKPEPDLYLVAAERLGARPSACLAVEDSRLGVTAAKRAGLSCLGFRSAHNADQDLSGADAEIRRLADLLLHLGP